MSSVPNDELYKEIDLIQSCIERMARMSFMIKGWALTVLAGGLAILQNDIFQSPFLTFCVIIVPYWCFWFLDAFFLHTEKCFRVLYQWVIENRKIGNTEHQYDLNPHRLSNCCDSRIKVFFSTTLLIFFGLPSLILLGVSVVCYFFY